MILPRPAIVCRQGHTGEQQSLWTIMGRWVVERMLRPGHRCVCRSPLKGATSDVEG